MDSYILPKHVWEKYDAKAITKYNGQDGVGSGPFTLTEAKRGQFWTMQANDSYWGGRPEVDEVVFRFFNNGDAMVAALKSGEIDAAHAVPAQSYKALESTEGIVALQGEQGGFTEIAVNGGRPENQRVEGIGNGHPALSDIEFRKAIAHSIDKLTLIDKVAAGLGPARLDDQPFTEPRVDPGDPGGRGVRASTWRRRSRSSTPPATRTRTATASASSTARTSTSRTTSSPTRRRPPRTQSSSPAG